jgi:PAS domain S-box-containing protein
MSSELDELIRSLDRLPVAAMLTELATHTFVAVNDEAAAVFGTPARDLIGTDVLAHVAAPERDAARRAYDAIAGKVIDGYQVQRRVVRADGNEVAVTVWGRRVETPHDAYGLWMLMPLSEPPAVIQTLMMGACSVVLAVTDHDWQIEYMSADAELLGAHGSELRGFPLLGLVHPSAANEFLAAASRSALDHHAVTVLARMRAGSDGWADRYCLVVPVCEHDPPRLGVVITEGPSTHRIGQSSEPLDEHLRHAAIEARATQTLDALPALANLPAGSELSARQTEIVARLVAGQSTSDIAAAMFLSTSTVRNHLTATYRKFGVHSQSQLLAALLRNTQSQGRGT